VGHALGWRRLRAPLTACGTTRGVPGRPRSAPATGARLAGVPAQPLGLPVEQRAGREAAELAALAREVVLFGLPELRRRAGDVAPPRRRRPGGAQEPLEAEDAGQRARGVPDGGLDAAAELALAQGDAVGQER
jgi:hypothetical protein